MTADLHVHSNASDGSLDPKELIHIASIKNLKAIALCDHDTFAGIEEAKVYAEKSSIELIPAIELSCSVDHKDVHVLAYWPDYKDIALNKELHLIRKNRYKRAKKMVEKLNDNGLNVSFDDVLRVAKDAALGRSHVARAIVQKKYVNSIQEAFDKYLSSNSCCYIEKERRSPKKVFDMIRQASGVPTLAHPGASKIDNHINDFVNIGLVGIEVYHPDHSNEKIKHYKGVAEKFGLIGTGGSDFHARGSSRGVTLGSFYVEMNIVDKLRDKAKIIADEIQ